MPMEPRGPHRANRFNLTPEPCSQMPGWKALIVKLLF
jgi:hypothetical protein